ncbi:DNA-deoxyinosine glycosylase [Flavobacterium wongokense]|uniref:DNA-deoxyinosine glycosylase n=1 Tax=Flavobacterium wongokense TaxID=2910674 RepID=UPI001F44BA08|nr:DNA-deoxyinosine glycosylase [Flavobacterium sp. WG47]MCF6133230.1 DNA-deoxyinosine glycosylase [Flavobacterium sp. WG47]
MKIQSFSSLSNPEAEVLLLGTMPGVQSLAKNEYYGNPRNHFWKLLSTIFNEPLPVDYHEKKQLLLRNKIAVWDVLQACEREGSLDSAIMKEVPNDFTTFLNEHPNIQLIAFNGQKAAAFFKKYVRLHKEYAFVTLPSTSPAHAGKSFEQKLVEWNVIGASRNAI